MDVVIAGADLHAVEVRTRPPVHHAGHGGRTVGGRAAVLQLFDLNNRSDWNLTDVLAVAVGRAAGDFRVDPDAVHQVQGAVGTEVPQVQGRFADVTAAAARVALQGVADFRQAADHLGQRRLAGFLQVRAGGDFNRDGRVFRRAADVGPGRDDFGHLGRLAGRRWRLRRLGHGLLGAEREHQGDGQRRTTAEIPAFRHKSLPYARPRFVRGTRPECDLSSDEAGKTSRFFVNTVSSCFFETPCGPPSSLTEQGAAGFSPHGRRRVFATIDRRNANTVWPTLARWGRIMASVQAVSFSPGPCIHPANPA